MWLPTKPKMSTAIETMRKLDMGVAEFAEDLGVNQATVYDWIHRVNVGKDGRIGSNEAAKLITSYQIQFEKKKPDRVFGSIRLPAKELDAAAEYGLDSDDVLVMKAFGLCIRTLQREAENCHNCGDSVTMKEVLQRLSSPTQEVSLNLFV